MIVNRSGALGPGRGFHQLLYHNDEAETVMVERKIELRRRRHRKAKMRKLKAKLAHAKNNHEKETILKKIHVLSPFWTEPATA
jgi:hypothetical protein